MSRYYTGWGARHYNRHWHTYTERTLAEAVAMIDFDTLDDAPGQSGRPPRVLDVACGTGILLRHLYERLPNMEAYGVDASADMLAQAREALKDLPNVHLERAEVDGGESANLPYAPNTFDLITCTNTLHYIPDLVAFLAGLGRLLAPGGQLVLEDFARRRPVWLWAAFEWLMRRIEGGHVHAYTLSEAQALCGRSGLRVVCGRVFLVDWLWHGWALRAG